MKRFLKPAYLPFGVLICGGLTFLMRLWLFGMGRDDRGLLAAGSFPDTMSWILVAVTLGMLFVGVRKLDGLNKYSTNFPADPIAAIGIALAAISFAISAFSGLAHKADPIETVSTVLGILSMLALLLIAWCRYKGLRPNVLLHTLVCLYLMAYLISHYRMWSSYPQLQSYAFELLAIVFTVLAVYQKAAFDAGAGKRRMYAFFTFGSLFFSLATLPGCDDSIFFIGCAVWMFFTPCRLSLPKERNEAE